MSSSDIKSHMIQWLQKAFKVNAVVVINKMNVNILFTK